MKGENIFKKITGLLTFSALCAVLPFTLSCWSDIDELHKMANAKTYQLRDTGPAGGLIFHIVDNGNGTFTYYEAAPEDYTEGADNSFQWGGRGADMNGTGYTTGIEIGAGRANTQTIANFFDNISQSDPPNASYYDYGWASAETFTDGNNNYPMSENNNGVVAGKKSVSIQLTATATGFCRQDMSLI